MQADMSLPVAYTADRSKPVVPVLVSLLLCGLFYEAICFKSCLCYFVFVFLSPFSIAITSLVEERANLSAFHTFVRFTFVWFCLFFSSSSCLGLAAACNCGTPNTFLSPFFFFFFFSFGAHAFM